jgi:hypothetical protein
LFILLWLVAVLAVIAVAVEVLLAEFGSAIHQAATVEVLAALDTFLI